MKLKARLAQSVERQPFKLVVVGSSPTSGEGTEIDPWYYNQKSRVGKMEKHNPFVKWCFTVLSEKTGEEGLKIDL